MEDLVKYIVDHLNVGSKEFSVFLCSMLPIIELRGGIPIGILHFDLHPLKVYALSCLGNMIPVIPLVLFFGKIEELLAKNKHSNRLVQWYVEKVKKRTARVEKYEMWGLALFVAIPLPVTGAWTGSVAAFLMGISWKKAFVAIACGVFIAGIVVTTITLGGAKIYSFL